MGFTIVFQGRVKDDVAELSKAMPERIRNAITSRLTSEPSRYGKPLRGTLAGYWKLRVGDWRVVYAINGSEVVVLAIKHRSRIYDQISDRL